MKTKLYFGILLVLLIFLGRQLENRVVPNQQILLEFSELDLSKQDTNRAIEVIQSRLENVGVTNIQVQQPSEGKLKIVYFSDSDVQYIQTQLLNEEGYKVCVDQNDQVPEGLPKETLKKYKLNISEIQKDINTDWDFDGVQVVELNQKSDRFNKPKVKTFAVTISLQLSNLIEHVALKANYNPSIVSDNLHYKIPEIRAGPLS
ncbi:MAG: hypothetical protein HRU50_00775 [Winogradskyella sp.]|uniref:hypothetical protein n=1 Tax=Winogradskyella sp. TaxID=1883156 RepID=UPI0025FAE9F3|nr:hypothetical protein [Winogradskyella sp.]NRB58456.1 hypothetical protein [Winogradskyella sp.]